MAQYIKQGNIFGRVGEQLGKGLAEQIPKEVERNRLSQGLKELGDKRDLDPFQQLAEFYSIPGVAQNPQLIQSGTEFLRQRNQGNAFRKSANNPLSGRGNGFSNINQDFANVPGRTEEQKPQFSNPPEKDFNQGVLTDQRTPNVHPKAFGQPQVVNENPTNPRNYTRTPWTPQQRDSRKAYYYDQGYTPEQAGDLQKDDEARDLQEPGALREKIKEKREDKDYIHNSLTNALEEKLQKKGENLYEDVTGEMLNNLKRGVERDLVDNPKATVEDVVNDWSNRGLNLSKAKTQFDKTASDIDWKTFFKGADTLDKLKDYSDIFKNAGNSEEYFNLLKEKVGLTPERAALVAYPPNDNLKKHISKATSLPRTSFDPTISERDSRKLASDVGKYITDDDSILSVIRYIKDKDPFVSERSLFNELRERKDELRLNDRQRRELAEGVSDWTTNWADLLIFPSLTGSKR